MREMARGVTRCRLARAAAPRGNIACRVDDQSTRNCERAPARGCWGWKGAEGRLYMTSSLGLTLLDLLGASLPILLELSRCCRLAVEPRGFTQPIRWPCRHKMLFHQWHSSQRGRHQDSVWL